MHPSFKLAKVLTLFVIAGLVLSFMQFSNVQAASTTMTFNPVADAYVSQSAPTSNYGITTTLRVDNSPVVRSYLRFTVSGFSGAVTSAVLKIYANSSQSVGFNVDKLSNNTWTESGINFSNAPAAGAAINKPAAVTSGTWVSVDVSPYITGNGTYNLVLATTSSTALSLASREDKTHAPQLVVSSTAGGALPTNTPPGPTPTFIPIRPTPSLTPGTSPTPVVGSGGKDPIIFFNGDIVSSTSLARGQLSAALIQHLMSLHPGVQMLVGSTGDNEQENNPTLANYVANFGSTYGIFVKQGIFRQVRGNHDIQSAGSYTDYDGTSHASGGAYWQYFGTNAYAENINGKKLTDYSYNLGSWHIVALDELNGSVNPATLAFLKQDLAANSAYKCQLVYWHVPTYSSGVAHGDSLGLKPLNQAEYDAGVDIQLNGHDHDYQRFNPINPSGQLDPAKGITTFIDGIGGQDGRSGTGKTSVAQAASAIYLGLFPGGQAVGAIQFTLHASSADYALYDANNNQVLDSGTVNCH
jgi:acid phosphatase type 7